MKTLKDYKYLDKLPIDWNLRQDYIFDLIKEIIEETSDGVKPTKKLIKDLLKLI